MTQAGFRVPPGFTISTHVCKIYYDQSGKLPGEYLEEQEKNLQKLQPYLSIGDPARGGASR